MLDISLWLFVFVASMFVLLKASDYFTNSAERIGVSLGIPAFIVGVTIVAIGTSLPELASSIFAVFQNSSEIVVGNVIGSNIANIFLVLGVAAIIGKNIKVIHELIRVDLPILIGASLLLTVSIWDGVYNVAEALISLAVMAVYLSYTVSAQQEKPNIKKITLGVKKEIKEDIKAEVRKRKLEVKTILILILSVVFIYIGAKYTVESVVNLSIIFNIGTEIIALGAVALGTSLPELFVTISAVRKGNSEIAIGNIMGSTIFNSLAVMGIPALFGVLIIPSNILTFALPMMLIAVFLYFFITLDKEVTIWEGWLLVIFYVFFIGKILGLF